MATGRYTTIPRELSPESKHVLLSVHRDNNNKISSFSFDGLHQDTSHFWFWNAR